MSNIPPPPDVLGQRNPRIHRPTGIPSISRTRGGTPSPNPESFDDAVTPKPSNARSHGKPTTGKTSASKKAKALGFHFLSKTRGGREGAVNDCDKLSPPDFPQFSSSTPHGRERRIASMPPPTHHQAQSHLQPDVSSGRHPGIGLASPPIVDFTRFEDMYRSPRNGDFEGLISSRRTPKPKPYTGIGEPATVGKYGSTVRNRSNSAYITSKPALKVQSPTPVMLERRTTTARFSVPGCGGGGTSSGLVDPPKPASERKPDPRLILSAVVDILGSQAQVSEYLNMHELLAAHQLDQLDFEERDAVHAGFIECGRLKVPGRKGALVVLGEPLRRTTLYSSTTMVLGGRDHVLPILVVNCVEELYRTGIYQPQLFRTLPNRTRLLELIKIFDSEHAIPGSIIRSRQPKGSVYAHTILIPNAGFGTNTSLHLESTPDICALLTTYLSSLSDPVLPPFLFKAIWDWCELDDADNEDPDNVQRGRDDDQYNHGTPANLKPSYSSSFSRHPGLPSPIPLSKTYTSPADSTQILLAQLLLHLMPSPNFSLLVYLLAFFSQVALVREENGVGVDDLSRMFGGRIFGGSSIPPSSSSASLSSSNHASSTPSSDRSRATNEDVFNTTQTRREGEAMMTWFLRRWAPISEGLFDVVDDAKMGLFRRTMARKDSLGEDVLTGWLSSPGVGVGTPPIQTRSGEIPTDSEYDDIHHYGRYMNENLSDAERAVDATEDESAVIFPEDEPPLLPSIRVDMAPQGHSTPNSKAKTQSWRGISSSQSHSEYDTGDEEEEGKHERARLAADSDQEEIDIVDDYILLGSTTTPTPAAMTGMRSTPLEIDDTLDIVRVSSTPIIQIGNSQHVESGDERLMDISLPTFLNQTLSNHPEIDHLQKSGPRCSPKSRNLRDIGVQTKLIYQPDDDGNHSNPSDRQQQEQLAQALASVSHLERQLRNCTDLVSDTLKELDVSRRESYVRARRIVELEKALAERGDVLTISSSSKYKKEKSRVSDSNYHAKAVDGTWFGMDGATGLQAGQANAGTDEGAVRVEQN